jgi:two-component system sensor histidine kinase BaeS
VATAEPGGNPGETTEAVRIEVRDMGEGILPEDLPQIWERFFRGPSVSNGDRSRAGLGLALARDLTEAMGGSVEVESTVGEGSCFTARLPSAGTI